MSVRTLTLCFGMQCSIRQAIVGYIVALRLSQCFGGSIRPGICRQADVRPYTYLVFRQAVLQQFHLSPVPRLSLPALVLPIPTLSLLM